MKSRFNAGSPPLQGIIKRNRWLAAPLLAILVCGFTFAEQELFLGQKIPISSGVGSVATDDFNADGIPDLAIVANSSIAVLLADADGSFLDSQTIATTAFRDLTTGDVNNDGNPDLVTPIAIYLGLPDGTFEKPIPLSLDPSARPILASDFNNDGNLDVAAANFDDQSISIVLGNGDGTFMANPDLPLNVFPSSAVTGDFNSDGLFDLAVGFRTTATTAGGVLILNGQGDGSFESAQQIEFAISHNSSPAISSSDFNSDSVLDLVVSAGNAEVLVILGGENGTFDAPQSIEMASRVFDIVAGDFNGDGDSDFAVDNRDLVELFLNNGDASFSSVGNAVLGGLPRSMISKDLNGNGGAELITVVHTGNVTIVSSNPDGTTITSPSFEVDEGAEAGLASDLNGDGLSDLVVANHISDSISVLYGLSNGGFAPAQEFGVGEGPVAIATDDFNGDSIVDIAVANADSDDVTVLSGDKKGGFTFTQNIAVGDEPNSITLGDFNSDGIQDVATANFFSNDVSLLLGNGDGSFDSFAEFEAGFRPVSIGAADFNEDGNMDLVVGNRSSDTVSVFLGNGAGALSNALSLSAGGIEPRSVSVGDLNGDGVVDLAAAGTAGGIGRIGLFFGLGGGALFAAPEIVQTSSSPFRVAIADFNGDTIADIATIHFGQHEVSVLLGQGGGNFADEISFAVAGNPIDLNIGDFDGNGLPDLVTTGNNSSRVTILLNQNQTLIGDVNLDGELNLLDISRFVELLVNGQFQLEADINGDGVLDLLDVQPFIDLLTSP